MCVILKKSPLKVAGGTAEEIIKNAESVVSVWISSSSVDSLSLAYEPVFDQSIALLTLPAACIMIPSFMMSPNRKKQQAAAKLPWKALAAAQKFSPCWLGWLKHNTYLLIVMLFMWDFNWICGAYIVQLSSILVIQLLLLSIKYLRIWLIRLILSDVDKI